jgi:hypothetical protein
MARENKSETILHSERVGNSTTTIVVRQIEDPNGKHWIDVRQFFVTADDLAEFDEADLPWKPTRYGVRLSHAAVAEIAKVKLPKNPTDTKTVKVSQDNSIKLPAKGTK